MQEQNFEKQVRQKMEELSFTPSEPVWKKVEEEIRKKKDRRRLLFWLPFTFLLLGGGIWLLKTNTTQSNHLSKTSGQKNNTDYYNTSTEQKKLSTKKKIDAIEEKKQPAPDNVKQQQQNNIYPGLKQESIPTNSFVKATKIAQKRKALSPTAINDNRAASDFKTDEETSQTKEYSENDHLTEPRVEKPAIKAGKDVVTKNVLTEAIQSPDTISKNNVPFSNKADVKVDNKDVDTIHKKEMDTTHKIDPENKPVATDSSTNNKVAKLKNKNVSKWRLAVSASIGRSGVNEGLNLFGGGDKSLATADALTLNGPVVSYIPPSAPKKSSAFSFGLLIKKKIRKRTEFSSGLQYNFYSTEMLVGQNIQFNLAVNQSLRVPQFYSNAGTTFSPYRNKFHFISLPLAFDFQILKKIPLDFHAGVSIQQLLKTNALLYSSASGIYYNDNSAFNRTQIFSDFGINYSLPLKKKWSFQLGPKLSYAHLKTEKHSSNQHLFSYGMEAQFVFGRK